GGTGGTGGTTATNPSTGGQAAAEVSRLATTGQPHSSSNPSAPFLPGLLLTLLGAIAAGSRKLFARP
ncbi:MAG: hypothetical protein ABI401_08330, partial [Candidatus Dormibacter sp.]